MPSDIFISCLKKTLNIIVKTEQSQHLLISKPHCLKIIIFSLLINIFNRPKKTNQTYF
jgi:hypothetical protein